MRRGSPAFRTTATDAGWRRVDVGVGPGLWTRDDVGAGGEPETVALSGAPRLVRNPEPVFGLTLLLERDPEVSAPRVADLVESGTLALDLTIAPEGEALARMPDAD